MIYEDENNTREKLQELRKSNVCAICKGMLDVFLNADRGKAFLACRNDRSHQGIERKYEPIPELNIPTRRETMEEELGKEKTTKLMRYQGVVSLTMAEATEILHTVWPRAPEVEVYKAALLCRDYGLNPLMKHVFLVPFNEGKPNETWTMILGIKATRLIARRQGDYSYLDGTPRVMTEEEQKKTLGEVIDEGLIWAITALKKKNGSEARGYGNWPKDKTPYGTDKGNSKANMAFIHSERDALDRLFPGAMPQGVEVIDEDYAPPTLISEGGEKIGGVAGKQDSREREPGTTILAPPKGKSEKIGAPPAEPKAETKSPDEVTKEDLPDLNALCKACYLCWDMQPAQIWKELGYKSQWDVSESPYEAFLKIKAVISTTS